MSIELAFAVVIVLSVIMVNWIKISEAYDRWFAKYIYDRVDYDEAETFRLLPLIQTGLINDRHGDPLGWYCLAYLPSFRHQVLHDVMSKREITGWWIPYRMAVMEINDDGEIEKRVYNGLMLWEEDPHEVWKRKNCEQYFDLSTGEKPLTAKTRLSQDAKYE